MKEQVESRLANGETLRSIAASLGISHQALSEKRHRWGAMPLRKSPTFRPRRTDGTFIDRWGYVMVKTSSRPGALAYTAEHVIISEQKIGRTLQRNEVVHHINGDKADNRPENLLVCNRTKHMKVHKDLESLAMELVNTGRIVFDGETYRWKES